MAAELERRGFTVALPLSNVKDFDLLAIHRPTNRQIAVQVKTTRHNKKEWVLRESNENLINEHFFYIFVTLSGLEQPEYHIVPSAVLAEYLKSEYEKWIHAPGKNGKQHQDTSIRIFKDYEDHYLDRWDILI